MTIGTAQLETQLSGIAGAQHVIPTSDGLIVSPATTEEVSEILRVANEVRIGVKPSGAGTKQVWFTPFNPPAPVIVLDMRRMNTVREHSAQDLTAIVSAGCTWADMQRTLGQQGQCVALDALWPEKATVGGIVSVNDSGALRLRYGSLRDLIIGMTIVLADGTIAHSGGKVVKNVAGYDMHKLMTGAAGTLGVITQVNFRLHPIEKLSQSWTIASPDPSALAAIMCKVLDSQMLVSAMQLRCGADGCALDVMFAAGHDCLADHGSQLKRIASPLLPAEASDEVWLARQHIFDSPNAFVFKAGILPSQTADFTSRLQTMASHAGLQSRSVTQATGLVTASLAGDASACAGLIHTLREQLLPVHGSLTVLQMPAELAEPLDRWGTSGNALPLMRRIKQRLDPNGILNRGRFVGGI